MSVHRTRENSEKEREGRPRMMHRGPRYMGSIEKAKNPQGALRRLLGYIGEYRLHLGRVFR